MELEIAGTTPPSPMRQVFYNERGLRAGWRLLIYCGMIYILAAGVSQIAKHIGGPPKGAPLPDYLLAIFQGGSEFVLFLVVLFLTWIMSRIEHRQVGVYGLPLQRSLFPSFITGYFLWGFLPLAFLLLVLRALHVFYFGDRNALTAHIAGWGLIWFCVFLVVGFFEEYLLRGYFLYTLADGIGFWPAAIIQAILFALSHTGNGGETRVGIVGAGLFGLFAAATLWRTGNLWLAVGAHAGWDWGQSYFFGVNDSGFQTPGHLFNPPPVTRGPVWLTGGSVGPEGSVVTLILWAIMTVLFVVLYRKRQEKLREPVLIITEARK